MTALRRLPRLIFASAVGLHLILAACSGSPPLPPVTTLAPALSTTESQDQTASGEPAATAEAYPPPPPPGPYPAPSIFNDSNARVAPFALPGPDPAAGWVELEPGIEYRVFSNVTGTVDPIHVARMSRSPQFPHLTLDTLKGGGIIAPWYLQGVDGQVADAEDSLNFWGDAGLGGEPYWGKRSHIVVAINGSLIDLQDQNDDNDIPITLAGYPNQGMVQSGWYIDRFKDFENRSGFVWTLGRRAFIGGCINHPPNEQTVLLDPTQPGSEVKLSGINVPRTTDQGLFLYTSHYGVTTGQAPKSSSQSVEVVVRLENPLLIVPAGVEDPLTDDRVWGHIVAVRVDKDPAPIGFDQIVLSAYGVNGAKLLDYTRGREGLWVGINMKIVDGSADRCKVESARDWTETYAAIGVDATLVAGGEPQTIGGSRAPRSAIATNDDYIYFVAAEGHPVINGDGTRGRTGITLDDLAVFMADELDVKWAANLDGGGSTTMYINGQVVTQSGDYLPMVCRQVYLASVQRGADGEPPPGDNLGEGGATPAGPAIPATQLELDPAALALNSGYVLGETSRTGVCQRPVVNSLAMIAAEPMIKNGHYHTSDVVYTLGETHLRQGPGTNYGTFALLPVETPLKIADPENTLNGVYATGTYWWFVDAGELTGWVDEANFSTLALAPPHLP